MEDDGMAGKGQASRKIGQECSSYTGLRQRGLIVWTAVTNHDDICSTDSVDHFEF